MGPWGSLVLVIEHDSVLCRAKCEETRVLCCRVQVEELLALKASLSQLYENSCTALEELLRERYQLRDALFSTYR